MSVEASSETAAAADWPTWQGALVNGVYPLRRLLHGSKHSAVFLTECQDPHLSEAAIKIVPAERVTLAQLAHWRTVVELSHPRLVRLFDAGLCKLGGRQFLFVVMEHAGQTLAQVLGNRALTPQEVREMLPAILDALGFLHDKALVHGRMKPANILVVGDQLKLASDSVRPAGAPRASIDTPSLYEPPEADEAGSTQAGDMWGLGVTLVEALTQHPEGSDGQSAMSFPPATFPPALVEVMQRCLSSNPAQRPSVAEVQAFFPSAAPGPAAPVAEPVLHEKPVQVTPAHESTGQRIPLPAILATGVLVVLVAAWVASRLSHTPQDSPQQRASPPAQRLHPAATPQTAPQAPSTPVRPPVAVSASPGGMTATAPKPPRPAAVSHKPDQTASSSLEVPSSVIHAEMPTVPRSALRTIHGHVKVSVLVIVDRSGAVVDALLKNPGPSAYFARLAKGAARKWTFVPADGQDTREWLVRFEFTRSGVTGHPTPGS